MAVHYIISGPVTATFLLVIITIPFNSPCLQAEEKIVIQMVMTTHILHIVKQWNTMYIDYSYIHNTNNKDEKFACAVNFVQMIR